MAEDMEDYLMGDQNLDEFVALSTHKRKLCAVGSALEKLPPETAAKLTAALADESGKISDGGISQWLIGHGFESSVSAITTHRRGRCSCAAK